MMLRKRQTPESRAKAKARKDKLPPGIDSELELEYLKILEDWKYCGHIVDFRLKPGSIRLAKGCYYEPDFLVVQNDMTIEYHEVKGPTAFAVKSITKIKVAAAVMPWFGFILVNGRKEKVTINGKPKRKTVFKAVEIGGDKAQKDVEE